jgi:hypothetical protein
MACFAVVEKGEMLKNAPVLLDFFYTDVFSLVARQQLGK